TLPGSEPNDWNTLAADSILGSAAVAGNAIRQIAARAGSIRMLDCPGFVQIEMVNARERKSFDPLSGAGRISRDRMGTGLICPMPFRVACGNTALGAEPDRS